MLFLNAEEVREVLPMASAVAAMKDAFAQLAAGQARMPPRTVLPLHPGRGDFMVMAAVMEGGAAVGAKLLTLLPANPGAGRPLIHSLMALFDGETGEPLAILDGGALTAIRTGAVSGAATDFLARPCARTVAVLGAGRQGRTQLEAVCCVRAVESVLVFDVVPAAAASFASAMSARLAIEVKATATAHEAVRAADIVCCATTSGTPVFADGDVRPGTHLNAVGCYRLDRHEIPPETVARARVVVDQLEAAREEAGDIALAVAAGLMSWADVCAEFAEIVSGRKSGRRDADEITLFKSVGLAIQDVAAASRALANARRLGLGRTLP
ncbi:MAG: ornithine cyclodeaminase [Lentisphaeria bacterium]|nr:ornithine cyclodeaminase [Lentisphaeria bacterium]